MEIIICAGLLSYYFIKKYYDGGVCKYFPNMKGKIIVITGCNTGIGEITAYELAKLGSNIVLACRSYERTKKILD